MQCQIVATFPLPTALGYEPPWTSYYVQNQNKFYSAVALKHLVHSMPVWVVFPGQEISFDVSQDNASFSESLEAPVQTTLAEEIDEP